MSDTDAAQVVTTPSTALSASVRRRPAKASGGLVSTAELRRRLNDPELAIVDVRSLSAYNGWRDSGDPRGGHVPGAVAFPSSWLALVDSGDLDELLADKGLVPEREIVLYGGRDDDVGDLARTLSGRDYAHVRTYSHDWSTWASSRRLPVERLANHDKLVHRNGFVGSSWASDRRRHRQAGSRSSTSTSESRRSARRPHSRRVLSRHELARARTTTGTGGRPRARCGGEALGITSDTTVVLYGRHGGATRTRVAEAVAPGRSAASRAALILRYCGVDDIRLLDGGYDRWVREGSRSKPSCGPCARSCLRRRHPAAAGAHRRHRGGEGDPGRPGARGARQRSHVGRAHRNSERLQLHRPGGPDRERRVGNCGSDAYHMQHYRNVDNTMRAYPEIAASWEDAGITADKWVAFYCKDRLAGERDLVHAFLMGWQRIAVYDGAGSSGARTAEQSRRVGPHRRSWRRSTDVIVLRGSPVPWLPWRQARHRSPSGRDQEVGIEATETGLRRVRLPGNERGRAQCGERRACRRERGTRCKPARRVPARTREAFRSRSTGAASKPTAAFSRRCARCAPPGRR